MQDTTGRPRLHCQYDWRFLKANQPQMDYSNRSNPNHYRLRASFFRDERREVLAICAARLLAGYSRQPAHVHAHEVRLKFSLSLFIPAYHLNSIAIFKATPPAVAGTIGAIFNGTLQLGSAIGLAACSSIETSVEAKHGGFEKYYGRAAVFYFFIGVLSLQALCLLIFYRIESSDETLEVKTLSGSTENVSDEKCTEAPGKHDIC